MNQLQEYIRGYLGISDAHLEQIADMFVPELLDKNDFYIQEGQYCNKLSFVIRGNLRIYQILDHGKEVTQWISTGGDFVTDLSGLMFNAPVKRSIQALSEVNLYTIHRANYERIGQVVPNWHQLEKTFISKCFVTLEERIFTFLSMDSKARYEHFFSYKPELFNQVPLQYLASMLGMSPETFSRIRSNS